MSLNNYVLFNLKEQSLVLGSRFISSISVDWCYIKDNGKAIGAQGQDKLKHLEEMNMASYDYKVTLLLVVPALPLIPFLNDR